MRDKTKCQSALTDSHFAKRALVTRIRNSFNISGGAVTNFGFKRVTGIIESSVVYGSGIRFPARRTYGANSGPTTLAAGAANGLFDRIGGDKGADGADKGDEGEAGWSEGC